MSKKYALSLGGGSARGIIHIGVYKYIVEQGIEITEIAGTSMGSLIGALILTGHNPEDIEKILDDLSILKLLDVNMIEGVLSGDRVYKKLESLFGDKFIEDLPKPFKIVATDLNNSTKKVFTRGSLLDALRASISLPGVFKPYVIDGVRYVDGRLSENLPLSIIHGDDIIAVSASSSKFDMKYYNDILGLKVKKWIVGNSVQMLLKGINIVQKNAEDLNIELAQALGKNIHLIRCDLEDIAIHDFNKYKDLIDRGYKEAKKLNLK